MKTTSQKQRKIYRSAITGRFVTREYAERNPKTTVSETVQPRISFSKALQTQKNNGRKT